MTRGIRAGLLLVAVGVSCGRTTPERLRSADQFDGGGSADAGRDAGLPDSGRPDASTPDAGRNDAGVVDAGPPDAGRPDAGCLGKLELWLTADSASLRLDPSGNVERWLERRDSGVVIGQTNAGFRPRALDGGGIRFDGIDDYLDLTGDFSDFRCGLSAFLVARASQGSRPIHAPRFFELGTRFGTLVDSIVFVRYGDRGSPSVDVNALFYQAYRGAAPGLEASAPGVIQDGRLALYGVIASDGGTPNASVELLVNGSRVRSGFTFVPQVVARPASYIGKSNLFADSFLAGELYEFLLYDRAVTPLERRLIEDSLRLRWRF